MRRLLPLFAYASLILVVFWEVLWPPEGQILFGPDITRYHYFQRQFLGSVLGERQIPWWNPYVMMGIPYIEHPQVPVWYPFNLLFVLLPINIAISWYIALHIFLAMIGMYVLVQWVTSDKRQAIRDNQFSVFRLPISLPAWAAGVAFGFSAYFVARIAAGHIDIIAASAWMPWVVWAFMNVMRAEVSASRRIPARECVIAAAMLAMQLLAGHPMVAVYTLEGVFIISLFHCFIVKSPWSLVRVGISVLLGFGMAAIQLLPNAQYVAKSIRTFPFPAAWAQLGTPTVGHMLEFLDPFYFYSRLPDSGFGFEHVGYIGKAPLLFAIIAVAFWLVVKKKKRTEIPMFLIIAVLGLWMWLGSNAPIDLFAWVRAWFPLYSQIRIPARHIVLFVLSACVLFGIGLTLVKSKIVHLIVAGLVLVDLVPFARHHLSLVPVPSEAEDAKLVSVLTNDIGLYRFLPNFYHGDPLRDVLEFNAPTGHRIFSVSGYDTPPLRNMYEFLLAAGGYQFSDVLPYSESTPPFRTITSPYLNFLNVKYILVPVAGDTLKGITSGQFTLIKENTNRGWRLYENRNVFPRFFTATRMQEESGREAVLAAIREGSVDLRTTIIVDRSVVDTSGFAPDCPSQFQAAVRVTSYGFGSISLASNTSCNAFLVTSEVMYPGWTAKVDGVTTPLFEGNAAFRTLYVPSGTHTIVLSYRPVIIALGAAISIATIFLVILLRLNTPAGVPCASKL